MKFRDTFAIDKLRPAPYNPRRIDEDSFNALVASVREHGVLRPPIATRELTLLAGHQRTKAMRAAGVTETPVFIAEHEVKPQEEIRFNQLHNAVDVEDPDAPLFVPPGEGWRTVSASEITGADQAGEPSRKVSLAKLLILHGPWSNVIATQSGRILVGTLYAAVSATLNMPVLVRYVPDDRAEAVLRSFGREYGVFSYDHIERTQWMQATNQPKRRAGKITTGGPGRAENSHMQSMVWTLDVIPRLRGGETILDFGSGRGSYADAMRENGWDVVDVEFYRRVPDTLRIDHATVQRQIDELIEHIETRGQFDVVILDSVLNSAATVEGEVSCMTFINALCKPGGLIALSGKSIAHAEAYRNAKTRQTRRQDRARFFDENGVTASYAKGGWYFQKYHTLDEVRRLAETYIGDDYWLYNSGQRRDVTTPTRGTEASFRTTELWQLSGYKAREVTAQQLIDAVRYEFELPYPSGRTVGRSADVLAALRRAGLLPEEDDA